MCVVLFWVLVYLFPVKELVRKPEVEYYNDLELKVFFFFFFSFSFFLCILGPYWRHLEVPRLGVELKL